MYKFKSYNYYNNLLLNYNLLYLDNLIKCNLFIIFFNVHKITNTNLLFLKNEISKENCISLTLHKKYIYSIFKNYFSFLSSHIFCIFINNNIQFNNIIKLLSNINFFFSYKKRLSNIINKNNIIQQINSFNNLKFLHYIIFKILFNIIIIFMYFFLNLVKYLK